MTRLGFIYDQTACIGCNACQMACKDKNNLENEAFARRTDTVRICNLDRSRESFVHLSASCFHCQDAPCIKKCSSGALYRLADGTIAHNAGACVGCASCVRVCPYGAVKVSPVKHIAIKCDGCHDLRKKGENPACVDACLTRCLKFGNLDEFQEKLPEGEKPLWSADFPGLADSSVTRPNLLIRHSEKLESGNWQLEDGSYFRVNPAMSKAGSEHVQLGQSLFGLKAAAKVYKAEEKEEDGIELLKKYRDFFSGWDKAEEILRREKEKADSGKDKLHQQDETAVDKRFYDKIFSGTDPDRTFPLWASVADGSQTLLNHTTLAVIKEYHRLGYEPVWIDGNPPDYIGEQFAYLSYLSQAYPYEASANQGKIRRAFQNFTKEYTLKTAMALYEKLLEAREYPDIYIDLLKACVSFLQDRKFVDKCLVKKENCGKEQEIHLADKEGCLLHPAIADEEEHIINTGGVNNCGGICVIRPHVQENCLLRIESDCNKEHSPQIRACVRGRGYRNTFLNMGRLRYPMKRVGKRGSGEFERISWEEAVQLIEDNWRRLRPYGPEARYLQYGTGIEGVMRPGTMISRLMNLDGGHLGYFNSYSSACVNYMSNYVYGDWASSNSPADFLNSELIILWADNTAESIFGPERNYYLSLAKKKGIRIIVIDPRLSQTGITYLADEEDWFAVRPSTDAALADAMAYVIWSEGLQDQEFMDRYCIGFDKEHMPEGVPATECYQSYLFGEVDGIVKSPEWAEPITGIQAERIRSLARLYAKSKPACITVGLGAQRHGNGEQSARGPMMLSCLTGNVGKSGGGAGGNASGLMEHAYVDMYVDPIAAPYPGKIPVFLWTKAIEAGTSMTPEGDRLTGVEKLNSNIKMIFNLASDILINQHSDINDTIRILSDESKCEFIVASDIFMTPSARYADLILPATSVFENENMIGPWAGNNYLLKNNQIIRPLFGCRFEWEWICELAKKLGYYERFIDGKPRVEDWIRANYDMLKEMEGELPDYETFTREGGYHYKKQNIYVAFADKKFATPSGKIEIFSKSLYELNLRTIEAKEKAIREGSFREGEAGYEKIWAIPGFVPAYDTPLWSVPGESVPSGTGTVGTPAGESGHSGTGTVGTPGTVGKLQLIGWHTRRRCHSIHDNNSWQDEIEMPGLWIHPEDAKARDIKTGDQVEVYNRHGKVILPALVTKRICQGVVAMAQGAWYSPDKEGRDRRGSINVLTDASHPTPIAKGNPQHTNLVEVKLFNG